MWIIQSHKHYNCPSCTVFLKAKKTRKETSFSGKKVRVRYSPVIAIIVHSESAFCLWLGLGQRFSSTSEAMVSLAKLRGENALLEPSPTGLHSNVLTNFLHGLEKVVLYIRISVIDLPPPCWGMGSMVGGTHLWILDHSWTSSVPGNNCLLRVFELCWFEFNYWMVVFSNWQHGDNCVLKWEVCLDFSRVMWQKG